MRQALLILTLAAVLFFAVSMMAHEKVVVIPLGGGTTCSAPGEVLSQGQCWMDRNLGASRVATGSVDSFAYGHLYQWGRVADGHEYRTSFTSSILSTTDFPGHSLFITSSTAPYDWRNPQNDTLWQSASGSNNPCPPGFRIPTQAEWQTELDSWSSNNAAGAFASPLKLVLAGYRVTTGTINQAGLAGYYWSSTLDSYLSRPVIFWGSSASSSNPFARAHGMSVRCIKD